MSVRRGIPVLAVVVLAATAAPAVAFPQLTIRGTVTRCTMCHVSPAGGGVLTDYGRTEAADTLSRGGDPRVLGLFAEPDWLLVGGDVRAAALAYEDRTATDKLQLAAFPMQADLRLGVTAGGFTVVATGGLRGSTRDYKKSASSYLESNEHYVMWSSDSGAYVRAGRFFPVQGLRLPDHTLYVRRYTGTNLFEEPYALAAGYVGDGSEVHVTGFVHDPIIDVGRREAGGALYAELHDLDWAAGVTARVGTGDEGTRAIGGLCGRLGLGPLVALAEGDVIRDQVTGGSTVMQAVGFAGANLRLVRGLELLGWLEEYQEELGLLASAHHGAGLSLGYYPRAHWELIFEGRVQRFGNQDLVGMEMFQLHYYP